LKTASPFYRPEFIFQQDGAPAHVAKLAQVFLATNCSELIDKDERPPNSPDLNPLDIYMYMYPT